MGSVRNKRHAGRQQQQQQQQQHQHHATTKKKPHQRQDLRLTIALTKTGGAELKRPWKKSSKNDRSEQMSIPGHRDPSPAPPSPALPEQRSDPTSTDAAAELRTEEEDRTRLSPLQAEQDRHDDVTRNADQSEASTTIDADFLVAVEVMPRNRTAKKVAIVTKSEERSKEDQQEDEDQQGKDEEYEKLRQNDETEFDGDGGLLVTCGENVARLYLSRLRLVARERVQSQCIRFGGSWLTPNEFQRESGREAAKDWKKTIRHNGLCLKQLLSDGIFDFSVSPPVCLCVTCAAAAAAGRQGRATTKDEMEITVRHPSKASDAAAAATTPDKDECLISGLGSAAVAAAAAAASRAGDGYKKEKRRRRSKQRPVKQKTKPSAFGLIGDSTMIRSANNTTTRKRKSSFSQFDRTTAELPNASENFERLTEKSDELTTTSDELTKHPDRLTVLTDQVTSEHDGLVTNSDPVTTKVDGIMAVEATRVSELHPAEPVFGRLEKSDGDIKYPSQAQGTDLISKKRRKKSKKNFSHLEKTETQTVNEQDFAKAASHSATDLKIPDDHLSSKENQAFQGLAGQTVQSLAKEDGCNVQASLCFRVLTICEEIEKQKFGLDESQQAAATKYGKDVDVNRFCEKELRAVDAVVRNSCGLNSSEMATFSGKSPVCVISSEDDYKSEDFRSSSQPVLLNMKNADPEIEKEVDARETKEPLDIREIPCGTSSSTDAICFQQPATDGSPLDKSEIGMVSFESIHNIPTMPLVGPEIKSCFIADVSNDRQQLVAENPPVASCNGAQSSETSTSFSGQSTEITKVSEAAYGGVPANATSSRNPHLVAVIAELKQKKQLALTSGAKKQNETKQNMCNSDQSKGTGVSSYANDAILGSDVVSGFLTDATNPSCSLPRVDNAPPVSSTSGAGPTLRQSSGSNASITQPMIGVISKVEEGQSGSYVDRYKTKATSASGGRSESNRKRSCRPSAAEGKASRRPDVGKHGTVGKDFNPSIPLSLPSGLYGLSASQLASLPFPASPYSLFPPYLFMGFPLQPLLPSCPSSDGKLPSFGMAPTLAAASVASDQPPAQAPPPASRKRRSNQSGRSPSQKSRRGSQSTTTSGATAGTNPLTVTRASFEKTLPATSDLLNSMMAFDLLRSRIGLSPSTGPGLDSPKSTPFYFPWLKPDPSKADVLFAGGGGAASSSLLHTMTNDAKQQQATIRTLSAPMWSEALSSPHEQQLKRTKTGDFRPYDPSFCGVDKKATPTPSVPLAFRTDFKASRQHDKSSLSSTDQKPFSLAASEHSSRKNASPPESHLYDNVGALDLSLK